ncbi:putative transposase YbfD/YdcC [Clostridium punense]|uniref:Transposase YbfD/YdcC n=1 Tax=Clostridium punense TaxID=1054297 RepID=A0ABS4K137_9CLOT|nr:MULTISPECIES: hypothetical protein [Clostridium]EQB87014.1 hypothetical protein M918_11050 [Clostridium sp. BL8]MBP2020985.1 putative transposase YbfD/YdcC [Clostridium punense]
MKKNPFYALLIFSLLTVAGYRISTNIMTNNIDKKEFKLVDEVGDIGQLGTMEVNMEARGATKYDINYINLNPNSEDIKINKNYDISRNRVIINKEHKNFFRGKDVWEINNKGEKNYAENENFVIILSRELKNGTDDYVLHLKDKNTNKTNNIKLETDGQTKNTMGLSSIRLVEGKAVILMTNTTYDNNGEESNLLVYDINLVNKQQSHGLVKLSETRNIRQTICGYLLENDRLIMAMYPQGAKGDNLSEEEVKKYAKEKLWVYDLKTKEVTKKAVDTTVSFEGTRLISSGDYIYLVDGEFGKLTKFYKNNLDFVQSTDVKFIDENDKVRSGNAIRLQHAVIENGKLYSAYEVNDAKGPKMIVSVVDLEKGTVLYKGKVGTGDFNNFIFTNVESIRFQE